MLKNTRSTYIIAEIGNHHNSSVEKAIELIDLSATANVDAVKFQSFLKNTRISAKVKSSNYAEQVNDEQENLHQMFERLSLSFKQQEEIFSYARKKKIEIYSRKF